MPSHPLPGRPPAPGLVLVLLVLLALVAAPTTTAQEFNRIEQSMSNVPSYYFHSRPGEAVTEVYVWGTVRQPGLYLVGEETTLDRLLTLAGGPVLAPRTEDQDVHVTVRLYNSIDATRSLAYEALLEDVVNDAGRYPALQDGDVVEVETIIEESNPFTWRDAVTILTGVAALALSIERIGSAL